MLMGPPYKPLSSFVERERSNTENIFPVALALARVGELHVLFSLIWQVKG